MMQLTEQQKKEGWRIVKFGDVAKEVKASTKDPLSEGVDRYVGLEHIDSQSLRLSRWGMIEEDNPTFTKKFSAGDILFGRRRAYLKKAAVLDFDGICSGDIIVMAPKGKDLLPDMLPFIVQSDQFFDWAIKHSAGGLSPRTKFKSLADFEFPLPPRNRQEDMLEVFKLLDANQQKSSEALAQSIRLNEIHAAHTFSLNNKTRKYKKLKDFSEPKGLQTGPFGSQLHAKEYSNQGIPVIMPKDLGDGDIYPDSAAKVSIKIRDKLAKHVTQNGDFLFGRRGDIGRFGFVDAEREGVICGTGCLRFRPASQELAYFFKAYFKSKPAQRWLNTHAVGMTMLNLNTTILGNMPVPVLNSTELSDVIKFQEVIEKTLEVINSNHSKTIRLKQNLTNKILEASI